MDKKKLFWYVTVLMLGSFYFNRSALAQRDVGSGSVPKAAADIVFTNGKIYTVNTKTPFAEAVAVKDGKFLEVGDLTDFLYQSEC